MSSKKIERLIQTSPSEVYHYFTNSSALRDWMCDVATTNPHPGGHIYLCWSGNYYSSGEYIQLEKDKYISFTWFGRGEPHQTKVEISLKKKKDGTLLRLTHRNIGKGEKWAMIAETYEKQWQNALENLASVLETGPDLRITRRPMLGIYVAEFNPEIAEQLCIPVESGTRLEGVVDGMGAQKAGLQKDDVIVAMDGKEITTGVSFTSLIGSKHAGDEVDVTFYRGPEKKTLKMPLSGRSIPPIPASGVDLSKQVEPIYRQYESEIEKLLKAASEEECTFKPEPSAWNVKEVLAHLIHSELGWQNYASEIMTGFEGSYDGFGGNLQAHIDGTTTIFPTKDALFKELTAHDAETLSMFAHIPNEFISHKGRF
ncbi:MAG: SRPBCC domain-containing protein, partial [Anaerolineales bacterium]